MFWRRPVANFVAFVACVRMQAATAFVQLRLREAPQEKAVDRAASRHPHVWRMLKPYPASVTLSMIIFLFFFVP